MQPRTVRALSLAADAVCLALFVALGHASHDINAGVSWYVTVLWPFLIGWFAVALILGLYTSPATRWLMLAYTWVAGCAVALVLRAAITHRTTPIAFILVTYVFIGLATFGWRLVVHGLVWMGHREST